MCAGSSLYTTHPLTQSFNNHSLTLPCRPCFVLLNNLDLKPLKPLWFNLNHCSSEYIHLGFLTLYKENELALELGRHWSRARLSYLTDQEEGQQCPHESPQVGFRRIYPNAVVIHLIPQSFVCTTLKWYDWWLCAFKGSDPALYTGSNLMGNE